jgi:hypothetical protein
MLSTGVTSGGTRRSSFQEREGAGECEWATTVANTLQNPPVLAPG